MAKAWPWDTRSKMEYRNGELFNGYKVWGRFFFNQYIFKRFYLFTFRERKGGRKRGRETSMCGCFLSTPYGERGLQPRHMPWLGIELVTLWFAGCYSILLATPARACLFFLLDIGSVLENVSCTFIRIYILLLLGRVFHRCLFDLISLWTFSSHLFSYTFSVQLFYSLLKV